MIRYRRYSLLIGVVFLLTAVALFVLMVHDLQQPRHTGRLLVALDVNGSPVLHDLTLDTGELEIVGGAGVGNVRRPVLSPDHQRAAFVATHHIENALADLRLYIVSLGNPDPQQLTSGPNDADPQWSPDGDQIIFVRYINFFSALFMVDVATGHERQLTDYTNDLEPDWSPDGERIVFTTSRDGFQELYTMSPDGSDLMRLTENENQNDLEAVFSPDGTMIAYMTNYSVGDGSSEIWVMDADGGNQRQLTDNKRDDRLPVWSPDSRKIVFASQHEDRSGTDIFLYDLDREELRALTDQPGHHYNPTWSPDGEWIGFIARQDSHADLYAVNVNSGDMYPLLVNEGFRDTYHFLWLR